ncbi:MAG: LacI family transcriptional regulator [Phycisphaerae bacterium]|nr:LacI family transcriptional regulator [Phycisphaerae bacterium]
MASVAEIARKAGVAVSSAYEILANPEHSRYQEKTRRLVMEASRELQYRPHAAARAIRTGRFDCVTLLLSTQHTHSYLPNRLLYGIHDELGKQDIHLAVTRLPDEKLVNEGYIPKILRYQMSDGLLINYTNFLPARMKEIVDHSGLPATWINVKRESDCVYPDNFSAGCEATEHLLKMGHRRIAFLDYLFGWEDLHGTHFSLTERCGGYEQAMRQAGLQPRVIRPDSGRVPPGEELAYTQHWLNEPDRPTAVVVYWVASALPVLQAAWASGLRVPQDLSIITFNSESFGGNLLRDSGLYITSMIEPELEMGKTATRMLMKKIKKPSDTLPAEILDFKLEELGTCCPPETGKSDE